MVLSFVAEQTFHTRNGTRIADSRDGRNRPELAAAGRPQATRNSVTSCSYDVTTGRDVTGTSQREDRRRHSGQPFRRPDGQAARTPSGGQSPFQWRRPAVRPSNSGHRDYSGISDVTNELRSRRPMWWRCNRRSSYRVLCCGVARERKTCNDIIGGSRGGLDWDTNGRSQNDAAKSARIGL